MGALPLRPAQYIITKMLPCIQDVPSGLEDLFRLSSHPSCNLPVSQEEHVSSWSSLNLPVEMMVSSRIVAFLVCWTMLTPD